MDNVTGVTIQVINIPSTPLIDLQFIQNIYREVMKAINNSDNVSGLRSGEFEILKPGIKENWNELFKKGVLEVTGTDKDVRPYFVALQGIIENVLATELNKSIFNLTGVIHTPMPATPLCTEGCISKELLDPSVFNDPLRSFTVKARATIVRDYLYQGGDLYVVYPKEGMKGRNEIQQQIYMKALKDFPSHLFDRPLESEAIDNDLIGAFYLFKDKEENLFAFAIKMTQANHIQDLGHFGLWFGEVDKSSPIYGRISNIQENVLKHSIQPIPLI